MPNNNLIKSEIRQDADGRVSFILRAPIEYSTYVPKDLLRQPPKWAKDLVERGTSFVELVQTVGEVARGTESRAQHRSLLGVVEQLALTYEGRQIASNSPWSLHRRTNATEHSLGPDRVRSDR